MGILNAQVSLKVSGNFEQAVDVGSVKYPVNISATKNLSNGTGLNQANQVFTDIRALSAGANENLDLAGGLFDVFGNAITFTKIKSILITAAAGNTNSVNVSRPATNGLPLFIAAGDGIALDPDAAFSAVFPSAAGIAVTAGSGDLLNIANSSGGTSVTYTVVIIGTV